MAIKPNIDLTGLEMVPAPEGMAADNRYYEALNPQFYAASGRSRRNPMLASMYGEGAEEPIAATPSVVSYGSPIDIIPNSDHNADPGGYIGGSPVTGGPFDTGEDPFNIGSDIATSMGKSGLSKLALALLGQLATGAPLNLAGISGSILPSMLSPMALLSVLNKASGSYMGQSRAAEDADAVIAMTGNEQLANYAGEYSLEQQPETALGFAGQHLTNAMGITTPKTGIPSLIAQGLYAIGPGMENPEVSKKAMISALEQWLIENAPDRVETDQTVDTPDLPGLTTDLQAISGEDAIGLTGTDVHTPESLDQELAAIASGGEPGEGAGVDYGGGISQQEAEGLASVGISTPGDAQTAMEEAISSGQASELVTGQSTDVHTAESLDAELAQLADMKKQYSNMSSKSKEQQGYTLKSAIRALSNKLGVGTAGASTGGPGGDKSLSKDLTNYESYQSDWEGINEDIGGGSSGSGGGGGCIIITACGADEASIDIARTFRDRYLTDETLGGYYAIAHIVVPIIKRVEILKRLTKRFLVDRLLDFAKAQMSIQWVYNFRSSKAVTLNFLRLCGFIGSKFNCKNLLDQHRR